MNKSEMADLSPIALEALEDPTAGELDEPAIPGTCGTFLDKVVRS
jgi:hypothetical protein